MRLPPSLISGVVVLIVGFACPPSPGTRILAQVPRGASVPDSTANGSIDGRVVLAGGQPISGRVRITLSTLSDPGVTLYTDVGGAFSFRNLRPNTYTVEAVSDNRAYEPASEQVRLQRGMRQTSLLLYLREKSEAVNRRPEGAVVSVAELDPNVPAAAKKEFQHAVRYVAENDLENAILAFKNAIAIYPSYVAAINDLGVQYLTLKRHAEAIEQFETAIEMHPKAFNPRLNIGITLVEQRKFAQALEHLNVALSINSAAPAVHLYLGIALGETDELPAAERELAAALSIGGAEYALAHFYLAHVNLKKGEREAAIRELSAYLEASPDGEKAARAKTLLQGLKTGKI